MQVVAVRAEELFEHAQRVVDDADADAVHDMRVAIRRLGSGLDMFRPCLAPEPRRRVAKRLGKMADALGERRDCDVALELLRAVGAEAAAADRPQLEALLERLERRRRRADIELSKAVTEKRLGKLRTRLAELDPEMSFRSGSSRVVRARLQELLARGERALDAEAAKAQHEARIAAKRLRYALEVAAGCLGEAGERARVAARELQGVLGDVHDCDVVLASAADIPSLETALAGRRRELFDAFGERWRAEERAGTWEALERALERGLVRSG
jgi:CHAD domain-containing protein